MNAPLAPSNPPAQACAQLAAPPRRIHSGELLGQGKEVEIVHAGQCYRLRLTSLGKLILTK
jgi:hemin uptake protein HemP